MGLLELPMTIIGALMTQWTIKAIWPLKVRKETLSNKEKYFQINLITLGFLGSGTDLANVFSQNLATHMAAAGAGSYPYAIYPTVTATSTYDFGKTLECRSLTHIELAKLCPFSGTAFSIPISNPIVSSTSSSNSGGANAIMSAPQVHHITANNPQG